MQNVNGKLKLFLSNVLSGASTKFPILIEQFLVALSIPIAEDKKKVMQLKFGER